MASGQGRFETEEKLGRGVADKKIAKLRAEEKGGRGGWAELAVEEDQRKKQSQERTECKS